MDTSTLYRFVYIKRPLTEFFSERSLVPEEYLMDWLKDTSDYERVHSDEELQRFLLLTPEQILSWLEEAAEFVWKVKRFAD
ncbi:MAG: hypothetical protein ACLFVT_03765 [Syntrophobacteria bacterium]